MLSCGSGVYEMTIRYQLAFLIGACDLRTVVFEIAVPLMLISILCRIWMAKSFTLCRIRTPDFFHPSRLASNSRLLLSLSGSRTLSNADM